MARSENAKKLADGYTASKRAGECVSISLFSILFTYNVIRAGRFLVHNPESDNSLVLYTLPSVFVAILLADFVSGVAHWAFDTWGSTETPFVGVLIRSFREHHVDQRAITRHDIVETNGDNTLPCIPMMALLAITPMTSQGITSVMVHAFVITFNFFVAITNQCHKWAHEAHPHPIPRFLMSYGIILTPKAHRLHHSGAHDFAYCITTGWLNPILDRIDFWRKAERVITALTGAIPRANDSELLKEK